MQENQQTRAAQRILGAARRSRFAHLERGGHVGSCDDDMYLLMCCISFLESGKFKILHCKKCRLFHIWWLGSCERRPSEMSEGPVTPCDAFCEGCQSREKHTLMKCQTFYRIFSIVFGITDKLLLLPKGILWICSQYKSRTNNAYLMKNKPS